jgi:deoxyadenosine/deoxycytidine kinase
VIFLEGARITLEAHIAEYPERYHAALRRVLWIGDGWTPDRTVVLTASPETIAANLRRRNREYEGVENMVRRFRLIDAEFGRLAPGCPNAVVVNRDRLDFHDRGGLLDLIHAAGLPPFEEIPYERMDAK